MSLRSFIIGCSLLNSQACSQILSGRVPNPLLAMEIWEKQLDFSFQSHHIEEVVALNCPDFCKVYACYPDIFSPHFPPLCLLARFLQCFI